MPLNHKGPGRVRDSVSVGGADRRDRRRIAGLLASMPDGVAVFSWLAKATRMPRHRLNSALAHDWFLRAGCRVYLTEAGRANGLEASDERT